VSEPVLLVDDTSVMYSRKDFSSVSDLLLSHVIAWFAANNLVSNLGKMNIMKFITKNLSHSTLHIVFKKKVYGNSEYKTSWFINSLPHDLEEQN
jgi:hypothetical protein